MLAIDLPQARRLALGVVLAQALVSLIGALAAWGFGGARSGMSALLGGGVATAGSLAMAMLVFGRGNGSVQSAVARFYAGEALKVAVVIALFVVVLKTVSVAPLAMFAAFAATFLVYWIALLAVLPKLGGARRGA